MNTAKKIQPITKFMDIGETLEHNGMRIHCFSGSCRVYDLTNAGKRGQLVRIASFSTYSDSLFCTFRNDLMCVVTFEDFLRLARKWADRDGCHLYESLEKGVDVPPEGFEPVTVRGRGCSFKADWDTFTLLDLEDQYNEPAVIHTGRRKTDPRKVYQWAQKNRDRLQGMTFNEIWRAMGDETGVSGHYYCRMD